MSHRGSQNKKISSASMSILLVSTLPGFCTKLRSAIFRARNLKAYTLKVHLCETVEQVVYCDEIDVEMDFIVFGMDILKTNCVEQVKQDLKLLSSPVLSSGNYCLVINSSVPSFEMGVTWDGIQYLQTMYQMPLICGDTEDEDKCNYLGERILHFIESIKGIHTGFPLFTALSYDKREEGNMAARRRLSFMDA